MKTINHKILAESVKSLLAVLIVTMIGVKTNQVFAQAPGGGTTGTTHCKTTGCPFGDCEITCSGTTGGGGGGGAACSCAWGFGSCICGGGGGGSLHISVNTAQLSSLTEYIQYLTSLKDRNLNSVLSQTKTLRQLALSPKINVSSFSENLDKYRNSIEKLPRILQGKLQGYIDLQEKHLSKQSMIK
jgi:hypothetical protein